MFDDDWQVNLEAMTCRNCTTGIEVVFEKNGKALIGKINDMPIELMQNLAETKVSDTIFGNEKQGKRRAIGLEP